ncbi:MAG: hypothetical protein ACM3X0_10510 [Bacteroidota bacterium]
MTHPFLLAWSKATELTVAGFRLAGMPPPSAGTPPGPPAERVLVPTPDDVIAASPQPGPGALRGQLAGATGALAKLEEQLATFQNMGVCPVGTCQQLLTQTDEIRQALLDLNTVLTKINSLAIKR